MVSSVANRRGRGLFGCLFPIILLVAFIYVAVQFGRPWFAYRQYQQEMRYVAKLNESLGDSVMVVRIRARADSLRLPNEAKRLSIRRFSEPARLEIRAEYRETVTLPIVGEKVLTFKPSAVEPL